LKGGDAQLGADHFLSTAQLNIVALSLFLAAALTQQWSKLGTLVIDDPLQSMDDLNAYALLDLIHGLITNVDRQIIVTTSNRDFYDLAVQRFAGLNGENRSLFRAIRLEGVSPEGPEVVTDV